MRVTQQRHGPYCRPRGSWSRKCERPLCFHLHAHASSVVQVVVPLAPSRSRRKTSTWMTSALLLWRADFIRCATFAIALCPIPSCELLACYSTPQSNKAVGMNAGTATAMSVSAFGWKAIGCARLRAAMQLCIARRINTKARRPASRWTIPRGTTRARWIIAGVG